MKKRQYKYLRVNDRPLEWKIRRLTKDAAKFLMELLENKEISYKARSRGGLTAKLIRSGLVEVCGSTFNSQTVRHLIIKPVDELKENQLLIEIIKKISN